MGIYANQSTDVTLTNSAVTGNDADGRQVGSSSFAAGGGIANLGTMLVENSSITGNYSDTSSGSPFAKYGGGGIDNLGGLTITGSNIEHNGAQQYGGGVFNGLTKYPTSLKISDTTIYDNSAYMGGGVSTTSALADVCCPPAGDFGPNNAQVVDSTITGNHSFIGGGIGIKYLGASARAQVSHSTVSGNDSVFGGGVSVGYLFEEDPEFPSSGNLEFLDSTISGNYAEGYGGGALIGNAAQQYPDTVAFNNSTIASNEAGFYGGGVTVGYTDQSYDYYATTVFSTIVGNNIDDNGPNDLAQQQPFNQAQPAAATGAGFDLSFSLIENPGNASFVETPAGSNIFGLDPQLGPLANNGGPTETHLPSISSPVVDKGSAPGNLTTDQRGEARTVDTGPANAHDGTDIGSVELPTGPAGPAGPPGATPPAKTKVGTLKKKHKKRRRVLRTKNAVTKVRITFRSNVPEAPSAAAWTVAPSNPVRRRS